MKQGAESSSSSRKESLNQLVTYSVLIPSRIDTKNYYFYTEVRKE